MGIKGLYKQIGAGERTALAKLAVETLEQKGRPLRIAIDVSIWQFQVQSGKGGSNPALRTLYYRLLILLSLSIQPLFVFDGTNKPPFKRNIRTTAVTISLPNMLAKTMFELFGFPYITAPGEAEAECALLQQEGIVDAVLTEDVDTLMFGATMVLRNWSKEGSRGNKRPTHISVYRAHVIKDGDSGLDKEGMILVALMSGGDYIPTGIPGCGIKIACEAARAGFGRDLCRLSRKDTVGLRQWRERLGYELRTNESGFFRQRHKSWQVPDEFPDHAVLGYYTHPLVSSTSKISEMRGSIKWDSPMDIPRLRVFVADAFEWQYLSGAKKFIRGLAPAVLVHRLQNMRLMDYSDSNQRIEAEAKVLQAICARRCHFTTDRTPELRIAYVPLDIVALDLTKEETDQYAGIDGSESGVEALESEEDGRSRSVSPIKKQSSTQFDPTQPMKIWIMETFAKLGVPLTVETWEADMRKPKRVVSRKTGEQTATGKGAIKNGALDTFVRVSKTGLSKNGDRKPICEGGISEMGAAASQQPQFLFPSKPSPQRTSPAVSKHKSTPVKESNITKTLQPDGLKLRKIICSRSKMQPAPEPSPTPVDNRINSWTLSQRPLDTLSTETRKMKRYSTLGIYNSPTTSEASGVSSVEPVIAQDFRVSTSGVQHVRPLSDTLDLKRANPPSSCSQQEIVDISSSPEQIHNDRGNTMPPMKRHPNRSHPLRFIYEPYHSVVSPVSEAILGRQYDYTTYQDSDLRRENGKKAGNPLHIELYSSVNASHASSQTSLPSPSVLMSPPSLKTASIHETLMNSNQEPFEPSTPTSSRRRVMLRKSLAGAWKIMDQWDSKQATPSRVFSCVDVLDMTRT